MSTAMVNRISLLWGWRRVNRDHVPTTRRRGVLMIVTHPSNRAAYPSGNESRISHLPHRQRVYRPRESRACNVTALDQRHGSRATAETTPAALLITFNVPFSVSQARNGTSPKIAQLSHAQRTISPNKIRESRRRLGSWDQRIRQRAIVSDCSTHASRSSDLPLPLWVQPQ